MWIFRNFYKLDKCPDFNFDKNKIAPLICKKEAKEPTYNDIIGWDPIFLATPVLTNMCLMAAINRMIGFNVWNSAYQCALAASKYNNVSVERELLNFVRCGTINFPLDAV